MLITQYQNTFISYRKQTLQNIKKGDIFKLFGTVSVADKCQTNLTRTIKDKQA